MFPVGEGKAGRAAEWGDHAQDCFGKNKVKFMQNMWHSKLGTFMEVVYMHRFKILLFF